MKFQGYKTSVAPAVEPITVAELGAQLRLGAAEITSQTAMMTILITAVTRAIERITHHAFVYRTIEQTFGEFADCMELLYSPLSSITKLQYYDADNALQTLSTDVYLMDNYALPGNVTLAPNQSWPSTANRTGAVIITFVAGYGLAVAVPAEAKQLVMAMAVDCYGNPEYSPEKRLEDNPTYKFLLDSLMITDFY